MTKCTYDSHTHVLLNMHARSCVRAHAHTHTMHTHACIQGLHYHDDFVLQESPVECEVTLPSSDDAACARRIFGIDQVNMLTNKQLSFSICWQ